MTPAEALSALRALHDDKTAAINRRHGDAHTVKLGDLRAVAKQCKTDHPLALALWEQADPDGRLLALLVCSKGKFSAGELDRMVGELNHPKELSWFVSYVVAKSKHREALREPWMASEDDFTASAGWQLTTQRVVKEPAGLDLSGLLDLIERDMKHATERKQWSMNHCLAEIGIHNPDLRQRALDIGERLQVLVDYPASPGCTPPFAPMWINEMVRRREG